MQNKLYLLLLICSISFAKSNTIKSATITKEASNNLASFKVQVYINNCDKGDWYFIIKKNVEDFQDGIFEVNEQSFEFIIKTGSNGTKILYPKTQEGKDFLLSQFKTKDSVVVSQQGEELFTIMTNGFNKSLENLSQVCQNETVKKQNY